MNFDLFNTAHLGILAIFTLVAILFFVLVTKFKQSDKWKEKILQFLAIGTFIVHISVLWWLFITTNADFVIPFNFIWPLALCNVITFFNMVISLMNKQSKTFKFMATACAWLGIIGGILSLLAGKVGPVNYDNVRSLTSHFLMFLTSTYLFIAGYAKISVSKLFSVSVGLIFNGILGAITNLIFKIKGWDTQNAMWFYDGLISGVDATKGYYVAIYILLIVFIVSAIYERFKYSKEQRWYYKIKNHFNKNQNK